MIRPVATGVIAFLVCSIGGVLHVLMRASAQPGFVDVIELAPTVQATPANHAHLPAAARPRFLDEVLGPDDDIVLFEYVKRDNRETGAALVGIEISSREGYEPLWGRMKASPLKIQLVAPGSTAYRFLI